MRKMTKQESKHCMLGVACLLIICFILLFVVTLPGIEEGFERQRQAEKQKIFNICLDGCQHYDIAIRKYENISTYFDYCANGCHKEHIELHGLED